jgi:uncharacterized protein YraI
MKRITLFAVIGFTLLLLSSLYYFGVNVNAYLGEIENYPIIHVILSFLRVIAYCFIIYFFVVLYKKQKQ